MQPSVVSRISVVLLLLKEGLPNETFFVKRVEVNLKI